MPNKLIGCILILIATTSSGFYHAGKLSRRVKSLRCFETALSVLETEINYTTSRLCDAFLRIGEISGLAVFQSAGKQIGTYSFSDAWRSALSEYRAELCLSDSDIEILDLLSCQLGKSDREHQLQCIRHTSALLHLNFEDAREKYAVSGKLYRSLGVLSGIFFMIVLL